MLGAPALGDESAASTIVGEEVERVVDSLFFADQYHPSRKGARNLSELCLESLLGVAENVLDIVKSSIDLMHLVPAQVTVLINIVYLSAH